MNAEKIIVEKENYLLTAANYKMKIFTKYTSHSKDTHGLKI